MLETDSDAALAFDALIAVQVMGWIDNGFGDGIMEPGTCDPVIPHYSTDIAAAWQVVTRLNAQGWWCELLQTIMDGQSLEWHCILHRWPDHERRQRVSGWGQTVPEAICHAALAAIKEIGQKL